MIATLGLILVLLFVGLLMFPYLYSLLDPFVTTFLNTQTVDPLVAIFLYALPALLVVAFILSVVYNPRV